LATELSLVLFHVWKTSVQTAARCSFLRMSDSGVCVFADNLTA
jgi:hypothetical protein